MQFSAYVCVNIWIEVLDEDEECVRSKYLPLLYTKGNT